MYFATLLIAAIAATSGTVSAGTFLAPMEGQTLSTTLPFNFTFDAGRFFKETSISVSVLLASSESWSGRSGSAAPTLINDLLPTGSSPSTTQIYEAQLRPGFFAGTSPQSGNWSVLVVERYSGFGGVPGTALWEQPITFSD